MSDEIASLIESAKRLRQYALLSGNVSATDLIKSITPFDVDPKLREAEQLKQLQVDVASVARSIDPDTRHRVLSAQFGKAGLASGEYSGISMEKGDYFSVLFLVVCGLMSLWLLSSYSMLAVRTTHWLTEFKDRGVRDYILEMQQIFDAVPPTVGSDGTVEGFENTPLDKAVQLDETVYKFMVNVSNFTSMVAKDERLQQDARDIELSYYWCNLGGGKFPRLQELSNTLFSASCALPTPQKPATGDSLSRVTEPTEVVAMLNAIKAASDKVQSAQVEIDHAKTEVINQTKIAKEEVRKLNQLLYSMGSQRDLNPEAELAMAAQVKALIEKTANRWATGLSASGVRALDPRSYNLTLENAKMKLTRYRDIINGWILPVLFGALGAIVLCLTRTASKYYATPSLPGILARLALAMLGGALISIIFAPIYFAAGVSASASFVFVLCFIFGYSSSSFVTLLDSIAGKLAGTKV